MSSLETFGHSYASGLGLSSPTTERATALVAASLGLTENNKGVVGAVAAWDTATQGGWATFYNSMTALAAVDRGIVWYGINDVAQFYGLTNGRDLVKHALRAAVGRFRCGSNIFEDTDASVTLGTGWTQGTPGTDWGSGTTSQSRTTTGTNVVTIAVPSGFPGGAVVIGTLAAANDGAVWSVSVDGGAAQAIDTRGLGGAANTGRVNTYAQRLTGLAAGAHTIQVSVTAITGTAYFDWWGYEVASPPKVALVNQPTLPSAGYQDYNTASFAHVPTDADVANLNTDIAAVAAEFDSQVAVADITALNANASYFQADQLHPNATGHSMIATAIESVLSGGPVLIGYSGDPGTDVQQPVFDGVPIASPVSVTAAGTINEAEAYLNGPSDLGTAGSTQKTRMGIYADASGAPGALLASSGEVVQSQGMARGWYPFTFTAPLAVNSGDSIWLVLHGGPTAQQIAIGYDHTGASVYTTAAYASGLPDPFGSATAAGLLYAFRATLTPTGPSGAAGSGLLLLGVG